MSTTAQSFPLINPKLKSQKDILLKLSSTKGQIAVLIDPDKGNDRASLDPIVERCEAANVDFLFVGGSTVSRQDFSKAVSYLKKNTQIPIVIFPGASHQISSEADALLYFSLISGRNPDYLIGHHVQSAKEVFSMDIEVIPTGYILIDGGTASSVAYVSQTTPIPPEKESIAINTAIAGILQGKELIYLDAGSGAKQCVPQKLVKSIAELSKPVIVGGGIRSLEQIEHFADAGANVIVIGNKIEEDIDFLLDIKSFIKHRV